MLFLRPRFDLAGASMRSAGDACEHSWVEFVQGKLQKSKVRVTASERNCLCENDGKLKTYSFMVIWDGVIVVVACGARCSRIL